MGVRSVASLWEPTALRDHREDVTDFLHKEGWTAERSPEADRQRKRADADQSRRIMEMNEALAVEDCKRSLEPFVQFLGRRGGNADTLSLEIVKLHKIHATRSPEEWKRQLLDNQGLIPQSGGLSTRPSRATAIIAKALQVSEKCVRDHLNRGFDLLGAKPELFPQLGNQTTPGAIAGRAALSKPSGLAPPGVAMLPDADAHLQRALDQALSTEGTVYDKRTEAEAA